RPPARRGHMYPAFRPSPPRVPTTQKKEESAMSLSVLSLPVDIPWRRLCVSPDMMVKEICIGDVPRWRSSVAVFSYEPPAESQTHPDFIVSYLKVSCTITGFQPDGDDTGSTHRRAQSYWNEVTVISNYESVVSQYYACYGAIVEVQIGPRGSK